MKLLNAKFSNKNNFQPIFLFYLKPPGEGAPFPMHQDYHYFPYLNDSMVAIFIHLDDTNVENGGLAVFPGSHKLGPLADKSKLSFLDL